MNLSEFRARLTDFYGSDLAEDETFLNRIINDAYRELAALADWWWLEAAEVLRFQAPMTALSLVANINTAAVVPSGTAYVGTAYTLGWCATGDRVFRIAAVAAASPYTLTLDASWPDASAVATCYVWNDTLTLATDCDYPVAVLPRNAPNTKGLKAVDPIAMDAHGADRSGYEQEIAREYTYYREPSYTSSNLRIRIFPPPDEIAEYTCRYRAFAAEMTNDTATTLIPAKHEPALVALATLKLAKIRREDADVIAYYADDYNRCLSALIEDQNRLGNVPKRVQLRGLGEGMAMPFRLTNVEEGGI